MFRLDRPGDRMDCRDPETEAPGSQAAKPTRAGIESEAFIEQAGDNELRIWRTGRAGGDPAEFARPDPSRG